MTYRVFANVDNWDTCDMSIHRTLAAAGEAYQAKHTGNLRRVLDNEGNDVTQVAVDAANGSR